MPRGLCRVALTVFLLVPAPVLLLDGASLQLAAQDSPRKRDSSGVGIVYGKVLKPDGKPLGGAWLMIENLELGMIYRKDINPIGQYRFDEVYPGTYVFKLSPAVYLIKSPEKFTVKPDEAHEVEVRVVPAPREAQQ